MSCSSGSCCTGGFGAFKSIVAIVVIAGGAWLGYNFATTGSPFGSCSKTDATAQTDTTVVQTAAAAAGTNECADKKEGEECALGCEDKGKAADASACADKKTDDDCALACDSAAKAACSGEGHDAKLTAVAAMTDDHCASNAKAECDPAECASAMGEDCDPAACIDAGKDCDPAACEHAKASQEVETTTESDG